MLRGYKTSEVGLLKPLGQSSRVLRFSSRSTPRRKTLSGESDVNPCAIYRRITVLTPRERDGLPAALGGGSSRPDAQPDALSARQRMGRPPVRPVALFERMVSEAFQSVARRLIPAQVENFGAHFV